MINRWFATIGVVALSAVASHAMAEESAPTTRWYRGNTHTHTLNSDGDSTPDVVARWYRQHGYQFLFITDHEAFTDVRPLNAALAEEERFLVLPGQEVTQWCLESKREASFVPDLGAPAHVNALFSKALIWPVGARLCEGAGCGASSPANMPMADTFKTNIAAIRSQGALAQVNHPNLFWAVHPEDLRDIPDGTLLEIRNNGIGPSVMGPAAPNNLGGDDGQGNVSPSAEGFWDNLLSRGKVIWGVGTDDSHLFKGPEAERLNANAWIVVRAPRLAAADLQASLAAGNFYASTGVAFENIHSDGKELVVTIAVPRSEWAPKQVPRYETRFIGQDGKVLSSVAGVQPRYRFNGKETYVRAVTVDSNGRLGWTQPVFLDHRKKQSAYQ